MATAQPIYDYSTYDYSYDASSATAYPSYPGYEPNSGYAVSTAYNGYTTSDLYATDGTNGSSYPTVDPYSGYPTAAYDYPVTTAADGSVSTNTQNAYPLSYSPTTSNIGQVRDAGRTDSPVSSVSSSTTVRYVGYDYSSDMTAGSIATPSANMYSAYGASAHHYPPSSTMVPHRLEYYHASQMMHPMHYVHRQPQRFPYRLPPRGGYQRELDEPGDENSLLRHVIYVTGLPKEIQNETLAEIFSTTCGPIAPVDVRSPKPKIWVYKDRQTREGKGEATVTFINPESCQMAINYYDGKELFGRAIRVTLCPRRMYYMQKQNTPFNPAAPPNFTNNLTMKTASTTNSTVTLVNPASSLSTTNSDNASSISASIPTATSNNSTNDSATANRIATISSSTTLGVPRHLKHSLPKVRQTSEQHQGLLPTPSTSFVTPIIGNTQLRDSTRKELPRVALNKGNASSIVGIRPKPY